MRLVYTDGGNPDFLLLCDLLDRNLDEIVGPGNRIEYIQYNLTDNIHNVFIAYVADTPVGWASFRHYEEGIAEVKRVFVRGEHRRKGIAETLMRALGEKAREKGYDSLILETGRPLAASMALYRKLEYEIIPNYGRYAGMELSVCMKKNLIR